MSLANASAIDPGLPMYQVATMQEVVDRGYAARRLPVLLMIGFGVLALLVASVSIYAMLYGVAEFDPITLGASVMVLLICAGIALLAPLRRATRVDPITVLR